jgi:hypothetical protein
MAKFLKDVLKGKNTTTKKTNDLGGYKPKAGDEEKFAKKHEIEVYDKTEAPEHQFKGGTKEAKFHKQKEGVYESKKAEDTKCNMSKAGTYCPIHEMADCTSVKNIKELSTDTYHSAAHKAAKMAMGDAMGRSGPIFKKYAGMANKFRAKGMEQEKKEKAMKEDILPGTFVEPSAAAKNKAKKVQQKDADNAVVSRAKMGITTEEKMPHQMDDMHEGAKVDRMVARVKSSEKAAGKSDKEAESIAWATANKRGMLDNKNNKMEEGIHPLKRADTKFKDNPASFSNMPAKSYRLPGIKSKAEMDAEKNKALSTYTGKITKLKPGKAKGVKEANAVEPLLQDNDHKNEAAEMAKAELKALANKALHLVMQMPESMHVEPWCQAKIAQAKSMINDVHDYMVYGNHENEQTDTPMDITTASNPPNTSPNFAADVDTGRNV